MKTALVVIGLFVAVLAFVTLLGFSGSAQKPIAECSADTDCVPGGCCHPSTCVAKSKAPNCEGKMCTAVCQGPLDCGAGNCQCVSDKCMAVSSQPLQ